MKKEKDTENNISVSLNQLRSIIQSEVKQAVKSAVENYVKDVISQCVNRFELLENQIEEFQRKRESHYNFLVAKTESISSHFEKFSKSSLGVSSRNKADDLNVSNMAPASTKAFIPLVDIVDAVNGMKLQELKKQNVLLFNFSEPKQGSAEERQKIYKA